MLRAPVRRWVRNIQMAGGETIPPGTGVIVVRLNNPDYDPEEDDHSYIYYMQVPVWLY